MNQKKFFLVASLICISATLLLNGCKGGEETSSSNSTSFQIGQNIAEFVRFFGDSEYSYSAKLSPSEKVKIHREVAKPIVHEKTMGSTRIWLEKDGKTTYAVEIPGQYHLAGYYSKDFALLTYRLFPDGGFIRSRGLMMINLKTGRMEKIGPAGNFQYASLSPDGKHCLLVGDDMIEVVQIPEGKSYQIPVEGIAQAADPWTEDVAGGNINLSGDFMDFQWDNALEGKLIVRNQKKEIIESIPIKIDNEKIMEN
jgi:hypothetical protein